MSDLSFVRSEMLPERAPPPSTVGVIGWMRENLFNGFVNSALTILSIGFVAWALFGFLGWAISPTWAAANLRDCQELVTGHEGACWGVIRDRWQQLLFGFYPKELYWRPILSFVLLFIALIPVLFAMISRRMNWFLLLAVLALGAFQIGGVVGMILAVILAVGAAYVGFQLVSTNKADRAEQIAAGAKRLPNPLIFSVLYPFIAPWLLWGGSFWLPIVALLGFVLGWAAMRLTAPVIGTLGATILAFLVPVLWWLFAAAGFAEVAHGVLPLGIEAVESRLFGGMLLSLTIGVVAISVSLPIGIVLALGRQSDLMIVKALCVGFIEFIRGVPLITLLFVASTLLNIFMPKGTNFDIILRVIIMATLFSSAYMAETIRGGLAALPRGQYEAADALGLDYWKAQRLIIMPQALKISIPGIVSNFIGLFKDTTLVSIIGLLDPLGLSNTIRAHTDWVGIYWELFAVIALMFFVFCFSMSRYSMYLERRLRTDHR